MIKAILRRIKRRRTLQMAVMEITESRDLWREIARTNKIVADKHRRALEKRQDHCLRLEAQVERLKDEHRLACEKCRRIDAMDAKIREEMSDEKRTG